MLGRREDLETREIPLDGGTFVAGDPPGGRDEADGWRPFRAQVRIRHRAPLVEATVRPASTTEPARGGRWIVETDDAGLGDRARPGVRPVRRRPVPRRRPDRRARPVAVGGAAPSALEPAGAVA